MIPQTVRAQVEQLRRAAFDRWQRDRLADDRGATWLADQVLALFDAHDAATSPAPNQTSPS